jgi:DNA topoisomerase-3
MKTVYLAEKPNQAADIAKLIGIAGRKDGYIELKGGDVMTWSVGHLIELVEPKEYSELWAGRWSWEQLPMIPDEFKYQVAGGKTTFAKKNVAQVKVIKTLLKSADRVVICTDAGREGELIARELLTYSKFKGKVERLWVSSLVPSDILAALGKLLPGAAKEPLYQAALARQHSDWMHGLSLTRAASLAADVRGDFFPVGRIQTPVLAMVARRDQAIKNFKPDEYFELEATVRTAAGQTFKMWYAPAEDKRIRERAEAERLLRQAEGANAPLKVEKKPGKEAPPMPYKLPALQKDAIRVLGLTAKRVLEVAQALYEKKAITYPRTDCEFLASSQKAEVDATLTALAERFAGEVGTVQRLGTHLRDSTFNDAQLTDHHAIVPTTLFVPLDGLELQVFTLVAQRYLQTISKDCLFDGTKVAMDANGVPFTATGKAVTFEGWRAVKLGA